MDDILKQIFGDKIVDSKFRDFEVLARVDSTNDYYFTVSKAMCNRNSEKYIFITKDEFLVLENYKLWLTHGHKYIQWNVKADLGYWAKELDQDIVVFGHTHMPLCEYYGDALLINPGSPSRPRGGSKPSFAVLNLQKGETPEVEFFQL